MRMRGGDTFEIGAHLFMTYLPEVAVRRADRRHSSGRGYDDDTICKPAETTAVAAKRDGRGKDDRLRPGLSDRLQRRAHRGARCNTVVDDDHRTPFERRGSLRIMFAALFELSLRTGERGVEVFAALRSLGREGVARMIEAGCRHAERLAEGLRAAGHEVLNEVVLNQVVVGFGDAEANAAVIRRVQRAGVCWCGPTHWRQRHAMRISVSGWATSEDDIERSLESILACAADGLERGDAA